MKKLFIHKNIYIFIYITLAITLSLVVSNKLKENHYEWLQDSIPQANLELAMKLNKKTKNKDYLKDFLPEGITNEQLQEIDFFEDSSPLLKDNNIDYYIEDSSHHTITNQENFNNSQEYLKNNNLFYIIFDYDKEGNVSYSSSSNINNFVWEDTINYYNSTYLFSFVETLGETMSQESIHNPKNVKIIYAMRGLNLDKSAFSYANLRPIDIFSSYSIQSLNVFIIIMIFISLFSSYNIYTFEKLKKTKPILTIFIGLIIFTALYYSFTSSLDSVYYSENNFILLFLNIALIFYIVQILTAYIKYFLNHTQYFLEDKKYNQSQLIVFDKRYSSMDQKTKFSLYLTLLSFILMIIGSIIVYSLLQSKFFLIILIVIGLLIYKYMYALLSNYFDEYDAIMNIVECLSQGEFDIDTELDLHYFKDLNEELTHIKNGFKTALNKEIKSEKMKTELITNVSHDLKTPLTSMITYIDLLKNQDISNENKQEYIQILDRSSLKLKRLIEDLFEISKANSGNIQLHFENIDIISLIKQTIFECDNLFKENHIIIKENFFSQKCMMSLDSFKTYRIIENLLTNAAKYTMSYTRFYIDVEEDKEDVVIIMKNISKEEMNFTGDEVIERFVRGDKSRNTAGSGLGLAITKSFCEIQQGSLKIEIDGDLFKTIVRLPKKQT